MLVAASLHRSFVHLNDFQDEQNKEYYNDELQRFVGILMIDDLHCVYNIGSTAGHFLHFPFLRSQRPAGALCHLTGVRLRAGRSWSFFWPRDTRELSNCISVLPLSIWVWLVISGPYPQPKTVVNLCMGRAYVTGSKWSMWLRMEWLRKRNLRTAIFLFIHLLPFFFLRRRPLRVALTHYINPVSDELVGLITLLFNYCNYLLCYCYYIFFCIKDIYCWKRKKSFPASHGNIHTYIFIPVNKRFII